MNHRLIAFFKGTGTDARGRRLDDVLAFSDAELERHHDWVQWVFPLAEPSMVMADAPLVDHETAEAFRASPALRGALLGATERLLGFFGLPLEGDRRPAWVSPYDHNYLRLTRIVTCLTLLGEGERAREIGAMLADVAARFPDAVGPTTAGYWRRAADDPPPF